ncbi:MAG: restriction endonuclease subunit R, partial [Deltaproteobacteria bacterium]|nr:restriction endonuclease subunit R [Deltaproteobacteria bacterium]
MDQTHRESLLEAIAKAEARLRELDDEKKKISEELVNLRDQLAHLSENQVIKETPLPFAPSVTKDSPSEDKVQLFRSLFRGREDVYPRYWKSKKSGKKGYSPVCKNEWKTTLCGKPKVKCSGCPNRDFDPVTDKVIRDHLEGKITIGVYPLLKDETCCFLAIDLDKKSWMEDANAFLETCRLIKVPAALERSRSGRGGHVWIFFSSPVAASIARQLGCYLLTETMSRRHQLAMDSYDRLFPNQDTMPKGGFGNLIALPLQKRAREHGNTVFIDENFQPISDQWAYLCSLSRM